MALQTELDSLGNKKHLSPDGNHTQEGLPCLLQTYVTLCWVFDRLGIDKSVYGNPMRMTTEIYKKISVPRANLGTGVVTGTGLYTWGTSTSKSYRHFALLSTSAR